MKFIIDHISLNSS